MQEIRPNLWWWARPHPTWRPDGLGRVASSYLLTLADDHVVVVDPLIVDGLLEHIGALDPERVTIAITIPYHVRDAEQVWQHLRGHGHHARITGHEAVRKRLGSDDGFAGLSESGPVQAHPIGRPRRQEHPVHVPEHAAIAFGDSLIVTPEGELRIWAQGELDADRERWFAESFAPTVEPLVDLAPQVILATHGEPVTEDATGALRRALDAGPWYHPG